VGLLAIVWLGLAQNSSNWLNYLLDIRHNVKNRYPEKTVLS
jgi:hypothetical protein